MQSEADNAKTGTPRNFNIDLIKAICVCLVLIWHLQPFDISIPNITAHSINLIFKEAQIALYFQVTLFAVPAFLLTSQYLYIRKLEEHGIGYFFKRLRTLVLIDLFWLFCQTAFYYMVVVLKNPQAGAGVLPSNPSSLLYFFLIGGPSLPLVGGSVFYYLAILIMLTVLSTLFVLGCRYKWFEVGVGLLIILGSLVYFQMRSFDGVEISSSRIDNFAIYTPIAYFLHKYGHKFKFAVPGALWLGYLLFSGEDIALRLSGVPFNVYGRVSIVCGAVALVASLLNLPAMREVKGITFLSTHSLGIFALHKYFEYFVTLQMTPIFAAYDIRKKMPLGDLMINFPVLSIAMVTVALTLPCVAILARTPLKRFLR